MEPPSKKQRLGEFLQNSHEQQGLSEGDGSISEAVRALLQQVQPGASQPLQLCDHGYRQVCDLDGFLKAAHFPGSAAAAAGLATLLRDMAGRLAVSIFIMHPDCSCTGALDLCLIHVTCRILQMPFTHPSKAIHYLRFPATAACQPAQSLPRMSSHTVAV